MTKFRPLVYRCKQYNNYKITRTGRIWSSVKDIYLHQDQRNQTIYYRLGDLTIDCRYAVVETFYPEYLYLLDCGFYVDINDILDNAHVKFLNTQEYISRYRNKNNTRIRTSYFSREFVRLLRTKEKLSYKEISALLEIDLRVIEDLLRYKSVDKHLKSDITKYTKEIEKICKSYITWYDLNKITWKDLYNILFD